MSYNGGGTFVVNSTGQPVVADTTIQASVFNAFTADIATGLSTAICKDGQTTPTANLPMGGYRHTGVGNAVSDSDYLAYGQAKTIIQNDGYTWCGTAGGTANALTLTPSPAITAYVAGQKFRFKAGASANTSTATLNVSSLGTVAIQLNGAALSGGEIEANQFYEVTFSDTSTVQLSKIGIPSTVSLVGKQTIWVPAGAMTSRSTSGASIGLSETTTNKVMIRTFDFDASTDEFVQFSVRMPKSWNEGTVTAYFLWSNDSGTGNVVWALQAVAISNDDVLDAAFGTAQTVTDGVTAAGDLMQSDETSAITIAGTPAVGDLVVFQAYRDADNGSDTLAGDARLHGVVVIYTVDGQNDA